MNALIDMIDDIPAMTGEVATTVLYKENCKKCNGSGKFLGYSGYILGVCFSCQGVGFHEFKTSPQYRLKARTSTAARKERQATATINAFATQYPAEHAWMIKTAPRFEFAQSMLDAVVKFGSLTEKQLAAVQKCVAKDAERSVERAARVEAAPQIDISKIEVSFAKAMEAGIKRPKLRLADFRFSPAPVTGNNAGAIYVKAGETYLGKIAGGKLFKSRDCDDQTAGNILAAAADPEAAAIAYGRQFGQCAICARELSNQESIDRGIGPICADKFGW
jgi:hypothetical protein